MSIEAIRRDIATAVDAVATQWKTANPGKTLVIEYDNKIIVDTKVQRDPFMQVRIKTLSGEQADLAPKPIHRFEGQIHLAVAVPDGEGSSKALQILDFFYARLQLKKFGVVRTRISVPGPATPHLNWQYYPVIVPFWSDQVSL